MHGQPGGTVVFRLLLFNGLLDSEVFSYAVDALDGEFDGDLRAPERPVRPGETVEINLDIKIPPDGAPGQYAFRAVAFLSRDNTIGVAQDIIVTVDARPRNVLPLVAGVVGSAAIGLLGLVLLTQMGSGDSDQPIVEGVSVTPTASAAGTPTPTTLMTESATPTLGVTEAPTQSDALGNSAPSVRIATPADGQVFCPGPPNGQSVYTAEISLEGDVSDEEDGLVPNDQISWTWALNGETPEFLANSASVGLSITASGTSYKTIDVVLEATDSEGLSSQTAIRLFVGGPEADACLS